MRVNKEELIKSPLNYTGGKFKLLPQILPLFPDNINTFVDLFAGGFNVGINVNTKEIVCNDYMFQIINLFEAFDEKRIEDIIQHIERRVEKYKLSKKNREGYDEFRKYYNLNKEPLDLYVLICFSFNYQIRFNKNMEYNTSFGRNRSSFNERLKSKLIKFKKTLDRKNISFSSFDFLDFDYEGLSKNDFVYVDPPYLISTGTYNDGKRGFKGWSEKEELELLEKLDYLNKKGIKFALSNVLEHKGKSNNILKEWSKTYNIHYLNHNYGNCNYQTKDRNKNSSIEVLITNY